MPSSTSEPVDPYSVLAIGYDVVMNHVDYEAWAGYVFDLLTKHHPEAESVLELGCGTASLALHLQALGGYAYLATDRSRTMVRVAQRKVERDRAPIQVEEADFANFEIAEPVDVVLLLYDGLNYLLEEGDIQKLFSCVNEALKTGGLFVFDQSTPLNSLNNEPDFQDEGELDGFSYVRTSQYDPETRLHTTRFDLNVRGRAFVEEHVQRAYELEEVASLIEQTPFEIEQVLDGFTEKPADDESERAHWVLRKVG